MLCQLQDLGRTGHQSIGVNRSGAMDPYSLRLANMLVGNPQGEACLEFALAGANFEVTAESLRIAFVGDFPVRINDLIQPGNASFFLQGGDQLEIGASAGGIHGYLAVGGGFTAKAQLGSCATHLRTGLGGFASALKAGNTVPVNQTHAVRGIEHYLPAQALRKPRDRIRAVRGPQSAYFSKSGQKEFFNQPFVISRNSDRMAYRLEAKPIEHAKDGNIISEPVLPGCVQIPSGGEAMVLMADCGTVGGYPKIASVISVDLGALAQFAPGTEFRFEEVDIEKSHEILREQEQLLADLARGIRQE